MDLLAPIRISTLPPSSQQNDTPLLTAVPKPTGSPEAPTTPASISRSISDLDDILSILRSRPSPELLFRILDLLTTDAQPHSSYDIRTPTPKASQVVNTLLEITVPNFWNLLPKRERKQLAECLRSITGLGGIVSRLRFLSKGKGDTPSESSFNVQMEELFDLLHSVLRVEGFIHQIWEWGSHGSAGSKRIVAWKEFTSLIAGGKLLSVAAEADRLLDTDNEGAGRWIGNESLFTSWLGQEIAWASLKADITNEAEWKALDSVIVRALSLGHRDEFVENLSYPHIRPEGGLEKLHKLIFPLPAHNKHTYLASLLRKLSLKHLSISPEMYHESGWWKEDAAKVSSIAGLIGSLVDGDDDLRALVVEWLVGSQGGGIGEPIGIRRALIAILAKDAITLKGLFEKSLQHFSNQLWIKHAPILQQEVNTQVLLLCAGYVHRQMPAFMTRMARSSTFLNGISNRIGATSERARFLGMVVGESFSGLVDKEGSKMNFGVHETSTEEAKWWKGIPSIEDTVGSASGLLTPPGLIVSKKRHPTIQPKARMTSVIQVIEEVKEGGQEEEDDDDLVPYAKPDSDPEDSEEDAADVVRKRDTPPVYIRDLLSMLRDTESYDRQQLSLGSAASLIRRKAAFGKELTDHALELTSHLAGMHDKYDMDNFQEMRMQALIALVVSLPTIAGPLLAKLFFEGDYSMGQRAGILSAIGIGARELAGFKDDDLPLSIESAKGKSSTDLFPSKRLPAKGDAIWSKAKPRTPLERITSTLERLMIQPMAAEASDKAAGPNVIKVRVFSSRIEVEKKRAKPTENKLSKVVAEAFFFPLTGRWWAALKDYSGRGIHFTPFLLTSFLKTLGIILHATGPSAPALPQMTREIWEVTFSLRHTDEETVLEGLLFTLLTMLELNSEDGVGLARDHPKELVETQEWLGGIVIAGRGGSKVLGLASGALLRVDAIIKEFQRRVMGEIVRDG
ncbi:unnamed protein product [Tuber melanosporum]|uniref:(Perigord truffle) hypothetical protein n=1 Tax=Tuber melanosporum (strain Mel28) TaxID=656061 RepID=D5GKB2_TUBMM|nr:uncharacterized protein GSTUM_00009456001 [Tuber melanosporum]CAZ84955.1 unnamed protein product [Tuber melanosporum]